MSVNLYTKVNGEVERWWVNCSAYITSRNTRVRTFDELNTILGGCAIPGTDCIVFDTAEDAIAFVLKWS